MSHLVPPPDGFVPSRCLPSVRLSLVQPMTGVDDVATFRDWIADLTEPRRHREPYTAKRRGTTYTGYHITDVPSLIAQLCNAGRPSTGENVPTAYTSRPAAHIEALDTLVGIDLEAARWVRDLGEDDPADKVDHETGRQQHGSGTVACIRLLNGLHASAERCDSETPARLGCCTRHEIERDVRRWWVQARIVTGWDSPAWRPDNTCPMCGKRGGLRVRLVTSMALCIECRTTWDALSIGLLAEHVRTENREDDPESATRATIGH